MPGISKASLINDLVALLGRELDALTQAVRSAAEAATHSENKPENKYDTRGLEASYLAGAQSQRARELKAQLAQLGALPMRTFTAEQPIAASALVELASDGSRMIYLLLPVAGGHELVLNGRSVMTVMTQSPLGRALVGKTAGDVLTVTGKQGEKDYEIVSVQ